MKTVPIRIRHTATKLDLLELVVIFHAEVCSEKKSSGVQISFKDFSKHINF